MEIPIGVPQGSTLGAILFNIFHGSLVLFDDDAGVVVEHENLNTAIRIMNEDLNFGCLKKIKLVVY